MTRVNGYILGTIAAALMVMVHPGCIVVGIGGDAAENKKPASKSKPIANTAGLDFREVVARAKEKVFPAVVFIKGLQETHQTGKRHTVEIAGSGVVISKQGEIVTNWHVVDKTVELRCLLYDGTSAEAEVIGTDKDTDLALIRLKGVDEEKLVCAELADSSQLAEGDFVMAMGAPWGLNRSVSIGIISCASRYLPDSSEYSLWLQTDAAISPGNSGGPLVDTDGKVVGINTLGIFIGGDMGFAVPSKTVIFVIDQLREHGKVDWSWTGLQLQPLKDFKRDIYFEGDRGVIVAQTDPASPARQAGFHSRDRIVSVNSQSVTAMRAEDLPAIRHLFGSLPKNEPARFELIRNGKQMFLDVTPRQKGDVEGEEFDCPRWDMTVKTINQFDNAGLFYYRREGVFVFGIKYPGNASSSGLQESDILLKIGSQKIKTLDDLKKTYEQAIDKIDQDNRILVTVLRNGLMRQVVLEFSRDYEKE